ncbi:MAG: response regulator transcription factor [Pseudomonadota bacterium]
MSDSVLVVEDHADTSLAICTLLQLEGYRADSAASGREALRKLAEGDYRVVILDLVLPDISGYEVVRAIKESDKRTVAVIAVSAKDVIDSSRFDDYLPKPFSTEELLRKVRDHMSYS